MCPLFLTNSEYTAVFTLDENDNFYCADGENILIRRLSTRSSVKGNGEHGLTYWKWYWQQSADNWVEYKDWVGNLILFLNCKLF